MLQSQQEAVLCRIATQFSEAEVLWALGGPMLLSQEGIIEKCEIIDLLLDPQDIAKADEILTAMGEKLPRVPIPIYVSQFFHTYIVGDVYVNLISGLTLHRNGFLFRYPFDRNAIVSMQPLQNVYIPCTAPEDWWVLYQLMPDREAYFEALDKFLSSRGPRYPERFEVLRRQPLPPAILAGMNRFACLAPRASLA